MGIYYSNILRAQSMPFLSQLIYTDRSNFSHFDRYNQTTILNDASELDPSMLADYGLPWFAATYASSLLTNNLGTTATITYMFLYHISDLAIIYNDFTKNVLQKAIRPSLWHWKFWDGKQEKPDKSDPGLDPHYKFLPNNKISKALCAINAPILCWYLGYLCVGINSSVMIYFGIALVTQYYVRRYYPDWYMKYNYILSAGLDGGTQVCVLILSWAVFGSAGVEHPFPSYWCNNFGGGHVDYCAVKAPGLAP
jgi:hypothetical protein